MAERRASGFSFRALGALFGAATIFFAWLFVSRILTADEIRTGVLTYGLLTGITAVGLLLRRGWGRSLALLVSLASAGLGVLTLTSVVLSREGSPVVPVIVFVTSAAVAFWLSRPVFEVRDE